MDKKVDIIKDADGKSIVVINDTRFAIPVYDDAGELVRYNVF